MTRETKNKIGVTVILAAIALISIFFLSGYFSSDKILKGTYAYLDKKRNQVLGISGTTTAAAMLIGALLKTSGTGIISALTGLQKPCLTVLAALFAERHLAGLFVLISFRYIVPAVCLLYMVHIWTNHASFKLIARKFSALAIILILLIPGSVGISKQIERLSSADEKIEAVQSIENLQKSDETSSDQNTSTNEDTDEDTSKDESIWSEAWDAISSKAKETEEKAKIWINNIIDALVIMIVTACVIPVLVFLFLFWILKQIFNLDIPVVTGKAVNSIKKRTANHTIITHDTNTD